MNTWNQWAGAAAYPTALPPGYGAPQPTAAPAIPTATPGLSPAAAAAAAAAAATVPYPAMPSFQAWPYAANPQAMAPWAAPAAAAPTGQATQWDQWNQWHQQYTQWQQQQYAVQAATSSQAAHVTQPVASVKPAVMPQSQPQPLAATTALTMATSTTTSAVTAPVSNVKRANEAPPDPQTDAKKPRVDQPGWNQVPPATSTTKELEELSEAEKQFDEQFKNWEAQFDAWRQQNANHPDIEQYKAYEAKWASWREQLLARREQMKKKREKLTEVSAKAEMAPVQAPLSQPPDPSAVMNAATAATAMPQMYPGSFPGTSTPTTQYQYQQPPPHSQAQAQAQYMSPFGPPSAAPPSPAVPPPQALSVPPHSTSTPPATAIPEPPSQQSEFLKGSSSSGIPGLDLLSGGVNSVQGDVKSVSAVSFPSSSQLPIQTPADNKPFDFPPPRQTQAGGFGGPNQQGEGYQGGSQPSQPSSSVPNQPPSSTPGQSAYPGVMQPPSFPPTGFPGQTQAAGPSYQGPPPAGGYPGFPGYTSQQGTAGGFQGYQNQQYQTPPSGSYQGGPPGYQQQTSGAYQGQPPANYPPPQNFSGQYPGMPPMPYQGAYQSNGTYSGQTPTHQQGQGSGGFQDSMQGGYPHQPPSRTGQGNQPYQSSQDTPGSKDQQKKLPGLMDNVLPPFSERNKTDSFPPSQYGDNSGDRYNKNANFPDDKFANKFGNQDRFGKDNFGEKPLPKFGEGAVGGKDNVGYSLPKPKGYFTMQEMSVEEEYEKFHEYQQGSSDHEEEDKKDGRRSRFEDSKGGRGYDDSRQHSRFDRSGGNRYDDSRPNRYEESSRPSRYDESRPSRYEDSKSSRFDGGGRQPPPGRFEGGRSTRFDNSGSNRFPQGDQMPEQEGFNRSFESNTKPPLQPVPANTQPSPSKAGRTSRWGAPQPEVEQPTKEQVKYSGPLGPPYGPNADGSNFRFAVIIDYNHTPADLGVPDYFEPLTVIDYTHGLHGIKVEEPVKDSREGMGRGGRVPSPHGPPRDRDTRDDRNRWRDERGGGGRGPSGGRRNESESSGGRRNEPEHSGRRNEPELSGRRNEPESDRDRRRSAPWEERQPFNKSRSPDRSRQQMDRRNNSESDRDRRDHKDLDKDRVARSRSPVMVEKPPAPPPPKPVVERQEIPIDDILISPGRNTRPPKLVIFLRGPPGSGKSFVAKLIKDKEVKNGGTAPRILSLDDYFMTDVEKEEVDPDSGRTVKKKVMEYEFEQAMEIKYRESLNKCFRKTVTDGYFPFIIIDANNDKTSYFDSMISFCKVRGFNCYIAELELDKAQCVRRNIHKRSEQDIDAIISGFEQTPSAYIILDIRSLLQEASIAEVDMEDSMEALPSELTLQNNDNKKDDGKDKDKPAEKKLAEPDAFKSKDEDDKEDKADHSGFGRFTISSKWDDLDSSCSKLDRLDGFTSARKSRPTIQDWLQIPDEAAFNPVDSSMGSKKRVRWADVEERSKQAKMKAMGFVVGHTDWSRMMDPTSAQSKLTQTKYI